MSGRLTVGGWVATPAASAMPHARRKTLVTPIELIYPDDTFCFIFTTDFGLVCKVDRWEGPGCIKVYQEE